MLKMVQQRQKLDRSANMKETIVFQCLCQDSYGVQEPVEIARCHVTFRNQKDTIEENNDKETMMQNESILVNKFILEHLTRLEEKEDEYRKDFYPIGIHFTGDDSP